MTSISRKEEIAKLKDYYAQREDELNTKHRSDVDGLKKTQQEELDRTRELAKEEIDQVKTRYSEKFTEKDAQHQKDIERLKAIYTKKLEDAKKG